MIPAIVLFAASLSAPTSATSTLDGDFDADGAPDRAAAVIRRAVVRLEIRSGASSRVVASADAPLPAAGPGGATPAIELSSGTLGSSGSLLALVASAGDAECRTLWRFRDGALSRVPIVAASGALADCGDRAGWSWSWQRPDPEAPAEYRRERTRETPEGAHRQKESFRYAGFRMELEPSRSGAEIRGIPIPTWFPEELYSRDALEGLYDRYKLSTLRAAPRIRIVNEPDRGVFSVRIRSAGREKILPVTASTQGESKTQVVLTLGADPSAPRLTVNLPGRRRGSVNEAVLKGFDPAVDGYFTPATRLEEGAIHLYSSAEEELAASFFSGNWSSEKRESLSASLVSAEPLLLQMEGTRYSVDIDRAPAGVDVILTPEGRSVPTMGVVLKGPNAFEQFPLRCDAASSAACVRDGAGRVLRRVGARINSR